MSESSDDGKSNPQIHIPAINRVVKFGPGVSKIFLKRLQILFIIDVEYLIGIPKNVYLNVII